MSAKETLCLQPWIHLASWNDGSVPLCCVAQPEQGLNLNNQTPIQVWNSQQFKKARLSLLDGQKIPQCGSCWKEEASGIKSHRQIENAMWERKLGKEYIDNLVNTTASDGTLEYHPITLDLRLGNTCNLQCVMCRPRDSSKWLQDSKKLAAILIKSEARNDWNYKANSINETDCFDWFEKLETQNSLEQFMSDIRHIIFGGGEPLLIKEHERFITKLVESGHSKHIELRYHTNGTILNQKFIELWENFKTVELMLSIDAWGTKNDYIRWPADWSTIQRHLEILDNTKDNIVVNILTTVHAMNVYHLPEFASELMNAGYKKICQRNDGLMSIGTTHWPRYLSTKVLPASIKKEIVDNWNKHTELNSNPRWVNRIKPQLEFMLANDESNLFGDLMDYIKNLDIIRPIKFSDIYSEYYTKLLESYGQQN